MAEINLLQFFKTGDFGPVKLGMTRGEVGNLLGEPDSYYSPDEALDSDNWAAARIWEYGGVELCFATQDSTDVTSHLLMEITFNPIYLAAPEKWQTDIAPWVFGSYFGPTRQELKDALGQAAIPYTEDKRPKSASNENGRHAKTNWLYAANNEIHGTLRLQSGVLVRYSEDDLIVKVRLGATS
jgi:hypothetical protein